MKRLFALALSALLLLSRCVKSPEPAPARALLVDGVVYLDTGEQVPVTVVPSAILGTIASSTDDPEELPTQDRQSNFGCVGEVYAYLSNTFQEEGIIVSIDGEWIFFAAQLAEGESYTPPTPSAVPLKQAVYPEFPALPQYSEEEGYSAYFQALDNYDAVVSQLRGESISAQTARTLTEFAARSTPLALAGQEGKNAVYSPLSLWSALALLAQSAGGDSQDQVLDALDIGSLDALQTQVSQVWRGLYTDNGAQSLLLGSSVWLNGSLADGYSFETLDILARHYYASIYSVPMGRTDTDQAVTDWISQHTNGLIVSGEPVVQTQADTLALLVSSLYYKDGWLDKFPYSKTVPDTFTAADGTVSTADFMHQTTTGSFFVQDGYQAASLYTDLGRMLFLLPDQGVTPEELLQNPQLLPNLISGPSDGVYGEIQWSVPKFDVSGDLDLLPALEQLGVRDLLDPERSDLSSLTAIPAYLNQAKQLARVRVDEDGVEGAAVTILADPAAGIPGELPTCVMDLDRSFLFILTVEDVPLFVGVVNQI